MDEVATLIVPGAQSDEPPAAHLPGSDDAEWDQPISDEDLEALALAADPDAPLPADAVPLDLGASSFAPLPSWYMAPVVARRLSRRRYRIVIGLLIAAFLVIDAFGLCATYGPLSLA